VDTAFCPETRKTPGVQSRGPSVNRTAVIPAAFDVPDRLKYIRSNLLDVIREYRVKSAGVRVTEPNADASIERIQIEGVIQEAFASSELERYYVGQISSISSRLKIDRTKFKPMVTGEIDFNVANWKGFNRNEREAVLCAVGALNA